MALDTTMNDAPGSSALVVPHSRAKREQRSYEGNAWRGGRVARIFSAGNAYLILLALLSEKPQTSLSLTATIESLARGAWRPRGRDLRGDLDILMDEGYVVARVVEDGKRVYAVSEAGQAQLEAKRSTVTAALESIGGECDVEREAEHRHDKLPRHIARLVDSLKLAFRARMQGKSLTGDGGNALRAAVLGANDGLVSNSSLVMGMVGAADPHIVLIGGAAGLIAGAGSMALGEWLSVKNARELYKHQMAEANEHSDSSPEREQREIALSYQARGMSESDAAAFARLMQSEVMELDRIVNEQLGLDDPDKMTGSPLVAALSSFFLFALGAAVPLIPYLVLHETVVPIISLGASIVALALIGCATSLFTGQNIMFSTLRQVLVGSLAAAITFGMGHLAGAILS